MKSKIKREIAYLDPEMTSREIENTVNNPEQLKKVMEQKMIGKTSVKVLNAVTTADEIARSTQVDIDNESGTTEEEAKV